MSREVKPGPGDASLHPPADDLVDFAEGTLSPEEQTEIRDHLETCEECRDLVRDLALYPRLKASGPAYEIGAEELQASLGALRRARLFDPTLDAVPVEAARQAPEPPEAPDPPEEPPSPAGSAQPAPFPARSRRPRWDLGLIAALTLLALSWGWQQRSTSRDLRRVVDQLQDQLETTRLEQTAPETNVRLIQVRPDDDPRRGLGAATLLPKEVGALMVIQTTEPLAQGSYRAEIRHETGEVAFQAESLEPQPIGFSFLLKAGALSPGSYQLWLLQDGSTVHPEPILLRVPE